MTFLYPRTNSPQKNQNSKPKVIFLIWALAVGGAERFLLNLVQRFPQERFLIKVVCISHKGVWAKLLEEAGIELLTVHKRKWLDLMVLPRLISIFRKERPDIVNTHLWTADLWGRLAAILTGVPYIIVTEQNVDVWKRWYHKMIDKFLFIWTDRVICVSEMVQAFYRDHLHVPQNKLQIIPNAIDLSDFDQSPSSLLARGTRDCHPGKFLFVCVARLVKQKAHEILLYSTNILVGQGFEDFHVLIVGDGELRAHLEKLKDSLSLSEWVSFLGIRTDIQSILSSCDAFILSSNYEGLPLSILEAMAAQIPVIATDVGGNSQVVRNDLNGYLVPPKNPGAFALAMSRLLQDKSKARLMGQAGRKIVETEYNMDISVQATEALFQQCLISNHTL